MQSSENLAVSHAQVEPTIGDEDAVKLIAGMLQMI